MSLTEFSQRRTIAVYPPRRALSGPSDAALPSVIRGDEPVGRLLADALRESDRALPLTRLSESGTLADGLAQVIRALVGPGDADLNQADLAGAQRAAIDAFIERRIERGPVKPDQICAAFGVSRATPYRLFREERGVEAFVQRRRLSRVFAELAKAKPRRGEITRVAERFGFHDPSNFKSQFRRRFGVNPSELLGAQPGEASARRGAASTHGNARFGNVLYLIV